MSRREESYHSKILYNIWCYLSESLGNRTASCPCLCLMGTNNVMIVCVETLITKTDLTNVVPTFAPSLYRMCEDRYLPTYVHLNKHKRGC